MVGDMNKPLLTAADVVALWPDHETMARDLGQDVKEHRPRDWARRGSIPPEFWVDIVRAGRARGLNISVDLLADIAARRRESA